MINTLLQGFEEQFGAGGDIFVFFAPGRVNLIGEHTDYNGGHVFPCALSMGTFAAIRRRDDTRVRLYTVNIPQAGICETDVRHPDYVKRDGWANYAKGVLDTFIRRGFAPETGFDIAFYGDIPAGSGLSSSAALEVVTGIAIRDLFGFEGVSQVDLALIGQEAENRYCGMNCGIMDQFASAMGKKDHAIFLDTATLQYEYAPVALTDAKIVIVNSKVKHSLVTSAYNDRRRESEEALKDLQKVLPIQTLGDLSEAEFDAHADAVKDPVNRRRAKHAVYENQRTIKAVAALKIGDLAAFGQLINQSHASLRDDYETSCPEVDVLQQLAVSVPGTLGSRITGGGFGGCTVNLVKNDALEAFEATVLPGYEKATGIKAEMYVAEIGDGAHFVCKK